MQTEHHPREPGPEPVTDPVTGPVTEPTVRITGVTCAFYAFDVGFQIDLDAAEPMIDRASRQRVVRARRSAPAWFDYSPPPLRIEVEGSPITVGDGETEAVTSVLLYDFGAAVLTHRIPLPGTLDGLAAQSVSLYQHDAIEKDARERIERVMAAIRPAIERPRLHETVEDYTAFVITSWEGDRRPSEVLVGCRGTIARAIEAERVPLAAEQNERSTAGAMSYTDGDLAVIDWNAAVLFDPEPDDVLSVLQHANIELLELRVLDAELDSILDHADETLAALTKARLWPTFASSGMLRRFASVQTDAAVSFEGVNNAIKLLGNQYLARLYRLTAERLDLPAWQASVQRKLEATESLYQKMSDSTATKRLEVLEWVIIVLIAVSMILPFTPWYH